MKQQFAAKHPWTILAAGAAIQVLTGLPAAWGVFQQPVMEEYGLSEQGAGYAFALLIAAFGVGCVLGGFLQDKKGPRCAALWGTALLCGGFFAAAFLPGRTGWGFFLAFSIPAGLGTAFLYPSIQSCAQKWYAGRKGLATGVIGGAVGLSGAFLTLFVRAALRGFGPVQGIRGAFWALGALTLPVCLAGSAVLSDPPQKKQQPSGKNTLDLSPGQMLRTKQYWLCAGAVCFSTPAVLLFSPIILRLGMERGLDETAALWSIVLGSVGSAAGRMLMPMLSDHIGRRATACAVGGVLGSAGLVGGGVLRRAHLLLLGVGGGAACPFHRPVRSAPCGGELRLSGLGAERGQPCVPLCSQSAGAGERAAPACHGRCGGGLCGHLGAASGGERPALKRAKSKGCKKFAGAYGRIDKNLTTVLYKAVEMTVSDG